MNTILQTRWQRFSLAALAAAGLTLLVFQGDLPGLHAGELPKLKIDTTPIDRSAPHPASLAPVVQRVAPSVVNIYTTKRIRESADIPSIFMDPFFRDFFGLPFNQIPRERREQALGSGVIVSKDGYILTNNHVVENAEEIKVALADEKTVFDAEIVGTDPRTDIAVIKVEARDLPAITITDSDQLQVGDFVLAIGNPFGVGQTVTSGIVSAKGRGGMGIVDYEDFIQTDASINPGNSGGALVDIKGRLVGINTAIISRTGADNGIGFAVPINLARYVMERLIEDGKVVRGYLGVYIQDVSPELAKQFDLPENRGALVSEVTSDSPAEDAGLEVGDVIVEFNGKPVEDSRHLRLSVAQTKPGTKVTLKVLRDGKEKTLTARLGELDEEGMARADEGGIRRYGSGSDLLDGIQVADLDPRWRRQFGIPNSIREGALVVDLDPNCYAAQDGLRPGDVILSINRQPVRDADDAIRLSRQIEGDSVLLRVWSRGGVRFLVVDKDR
ncbi:MAG: DegQ family serine endoprotease [Verrucomicrobia bacterium]|nr:MAG: DegQ family serine endoprotease [Verrucomicrobiota bacterium]